MVVMKNRLAFATLMPFICMLALAGCGKKPDTPTGSPKSQSDPKPTDPKDGNPQGKTPSEKPEAKQPAESEEKELFKVEIVNDKISINGVAIPEKAEVADIEKALGKSSFTNTSGFYNAIVWKDHGVKCLQDKNTKKIETIGFYFNGYYDSESASSTKLFKGSFVINGEKVTKTTDIKDVKTKLKLKEGRGFGWFLNDAKGDRTLVTFSAPSIGSGAAQTNIITEIEVSR